MTTRQHLSHPAAAPPRRGRRPMLSLEIVLDAAIGILDDHGESALTLRALAAGLDTGVGSLYHYVSSKDELLDLATNQVLGRAIHDLDLPEDPYDAMRRLSDRLYEALQAHPWMGLYLMRDTGLQLNSMRLFDLFGQQAQRLDLTSRQRFDAVSSLVSFVTGVGAELRELPESVLTKGKTQQEALHDYANTWRALDAAEFPFVHEVADVFETHNDLTQFRAGVDLFLDGLALQAGDVPVGHRGLGVDADTTAKQ